MHKPTIFWNWCLGWHSSDGRPDLLPHTDSRSQMELQPDWTRFKAFTKYEGIPGAQKCSQPVLCAAAGLASTHTHTHTHAHTHRATTTLSERLEYSPPFAFTCDWFSLLYDLNSEWNILLTFSLQTDTTAFSPLEFFYEAVQSEIEGTDQITHSHHTRCFYRNPCVTFYNLCYNLNETLGCVQSTAKHNINVAFSHICFVTPLCVNAVNTVFFKPT